jgi:dolichol-phosphate mannosyltransferase
VTAPNRQVFVLLRVHNDARRLAGLLNGIRAVMEARGWTCQILAIDDGSDDASGSLLAEVADRIAVNIIRHRFHRGLGESWRDGFEWIAEHGDPADVVVTMDAKGHGDPESVPALIEALDAGADVAIGSRFGRGARVIDARALHGLLGRIPSLWLRFLVGVPRVRDYTSTFRAIRVSTLQAALHEHRDRFVELAYFGRICAAEVLAKLAQSGARCVDVPCAVRYVPRSEDDSRQIVRTLCGGALLARQVWGRDVAPTPVQPSLPRWEWWALGAVMLAAFVLRLYGIERIPAVVFHDECDNLVNVYQILNGRGPGLFGLDWKPQPAASVYLLSLSMRAGMSIFTLRLPAALFSVAALVPFYLFLRRTIAWPPTLMATGLLATDIWYLHFSRTGWENVDACLFLMAAALSVRRAVRTGGMRWFAFAGLWSALGLYGPFCGRSVFPAVLSIELVSLVRPWVPRRRLVAGVFVTTATTAILFAPQVPTIFSRWDAFQRRTASVYVLGGTNRAKPRSQKLAIVAETFVRKGRQIFTTRIPIFQERVDRYLRTEQGALTRPTAVLLGAGMLLSLFWFSDAWLWWLLFLVPFTMTEALTMGSLNGARGITFVPVLYSFIGLSVHVLWRAAVRLYKPLATAVVIAATALALTTTQQYFEWVNSPTLLRALQPAIPVNEFSDWQAFLMDWTQKSNSFYNLTMWKARQAKLRAQAQDAAAKPPP